MIKTQTTTPSLFFIILSSLHYYFFKTCVAAANNNCTPSSCGVITNISYPFRLNDDPLHCGDRRFELGCEDGVVSLYLQNSQKYYVKDINYLYSTIRLVDASINRNDVCSFPIYSAYPDNFSYKEGDIYRKGGMPTLINLISCPNPLKNSSSLRLLTDITHDCGFSNSISSNPSSRYIYVKLGRMKAWEFPHMCELDLVAMTSWPEFYEDKLWLREDSNNVSLSEIHKSLLYGFDLEFLSYPPLWSQLELTWFKYRDVFVNRLNSPLLIIPVILVLLCAAVGPPVMALIALTAVVGLVFFIGSQLDYYRLYGPGFDPLNTGEQFLIYISILT